MRVLLHSVSKPHSKAILRTSIGLFVIAALASCSPKPVAQEQAAQAPAQTAAQAPTADEVQVAPPVAREKAVASKASAPKSEDAAAAGGSAKGISGGWVNAGGACDSGASVLFNPDGTYMSEGENGTWSLNGKTLTVTTNPIPGDESVAQIGPEQSTGDIGEKAILTVLQVNDTSASVILSNGTNANWTRCSG
jgi:hypothetical protein